MAAAFGAFGLLEAAVVCFGAWGGLRSPGTKSKIGSNLSRTRFRCARSLPSRNGTHVPNLHVSERTRTRGNPFTLVFSVATLNLFMNTFLDLSLQYPGARGLVKSSDLQDMGCVDPIVRSTSHDMVALDIKLIDRDLMRLASAERETGTKIVRCCMWQRISCRVCPTTP